MTEAVSTLPTPKTRPEPRKAATPYRSRFEELERLAGDKEPAWLRSIRKAGISQFSEKGFPGPKDEEWRFTNVAPIAKMPFQPVGELSQDGFTEKAAAKFAIPDLTGSRLVFLDGVFAPRLSKMGAQHTMIRAESLAAALGRSGARIEDHLGRYALIQDNPFVALNTAFFADGAYVHVPADKAVTEPIHLLFIATRKGATAMPRNLIVLERGSQATIVESYVSASEGPYFTNSVTEIVLGEGASAEHCKLQTESLETFHVATIEAKLEARSRLLTHSISVGAKIARNNIHLRLDGEGIDAILNGLYLGMKDQLIDHHTAVDHAQPHCGSHEFYHGILDGRSKGVFNGKIFVRPGAQKTDAKQTNRGLLLSKEATIDTKPQLEIFADDVKCTHGATIGQLNEEEIFYLRARGIGLENARRMLIHAFASDVINRIQAEPIRAELEKLISLRLDRTHG